ncbi:hypothetical protein [Actinosynnema mirum]|uniref:DUF3800 domain-containing protein n=1 Tax=Actinosynnema mirum (strain ATCC 29888 / DSM 43827 / JCM 3225 / NBRC 14064 / NCIMB 13271 / NRRL B-12336 / IMRU 3971 / 101) TaxID=446462 RepID=C6W8S1_ACTMD|nr:hypothetical protein [Actinosynnema mirum]ACU37170.1 hypothetical protein Amir_3263 [Actinosynnema mirum DSM 43827]
MKLIMVDDSEEKNPRRVGLGHLVGVGAVVFPEEGVVFYRDEIRRIRTRYGVPTETELKWSPDGDSWLKSPAGSAVRTQLRREMLQLAHYVGAVSVVIVWNRGDCEWSVEDTRKEVLKYLYDKVSLCVRDLPGSSIGLVIADEPGGGAKDHKAWLAGTLRLTEAGTVWTKPEQIALPIVMAPSHHVSHLQLADLVAASTVAAVAGNPYALELLPDLSMIAHRNNAGSVGGSGLTIWPKESDNLYHYLYGDTVRMQNGRGFLLPEPSWRYSVDDGLK